MNVILDLSDVSESSQLFFETQKEIRQLFSHSRITTPYTEQGFVEIQNELLHISIDNGRYFKRYLLKLDLFKAKGKFSATKRLYATILELVLYRSCSFEI